jgi:hypothetical protein
LTDAGTTTLFVRGATFRVQRTANGIEIIFPALRAPGVALSVGAFAFVCALLPVLGLSAMLPVKNGDAAVMLALALIGGMAAPFVLASVVFGVLAIYMLCNSLTVHVTPAGVSAVRRILGRPVKLSEITRGDIARIEMQINARYQNVFGTTPRYRLLARHRESRSADVVIAEDLIGTEVRDDVQTLIESILNDVSEDKISFKTNSYGES